MNAPIDRDYLIESLAEPLFKGRVEPHQCEGIEAILDYFERRHADADPRWIAYCLATAYHETAYTMQPVRETLAKSDDEAIARLDRAHAAGKLSWVKTIYWRRDEAGQSWLGRGLVQLTHRRNYETMGRMLSLDLVSRPERAMEMSVAVAILVEGMAAGAFTGHKLADYFSGDRADWTGARRIVNGTDRAEKIADYARTVSAALRPVERPGLMRRVLRRLMRMLEHVSS